MVTIGQQLTVRVAAATLWRTPEAPRPVDAPALRLPSDVPGWVQGMTIEEQIHEGVLTQLLLGERVLIEEVRDGWVRVVALDQPAGKLDPRGYPGWLPGAQLVPTGRQSTWDDVERSADTVYIVDAPGTTLRESPALRESPELRESPALRESPDNEPDDEESALVGVTAGTRLPVAGEPRDGWVPVRVPDRPRPLWVEEAALVPVPAAPPEPARVLEQARRFLGTRYVWGGLTADGIDCSGLVHLAWRRFGVTLPRDADDQYEATVDVPLGEELPGDLYFFARPGRKVHHVGFVAAPPTGSGEGDRTMVHACYTGRRVIAEPVTGRRFETLVGARRVQPAT